MRLSLILIALPLMTACSSAAQRQQTVLMNEIESLVKLPPGAAPLQRYDRYYTFGRDGEVLAVYAGFAKKPERKWVMNAESLPTINDGGCGVVNIRFDPKTSKTEVWCHGVA